MTAVRAQLEVANGPASRRGSARRTLRLHVEGARTSGGSEVLIRNISTTGLLLKTAESLPIGEKLAIDIPEAPGTIATVKWASGEVFGCQFTQPISQAAISACLLRADHEPSVSADALASPFHERIDAQLGIDLALAKQRSMGAKMRWIVGLAILSWIPAAALISLIW